MRMFLKKIEQLVVLLRDVAKLFNIYNNYNS